MSWFLFGGIAALLSVFLGITPGWFDSSEFAAAIDTLGVSHPTGHSTYLLIGKFFAWLPFGSVGYRTALFSLVTGLIAAAVLMRLTTRILPHFGSIVLAGLFLAHPSVALQITRTEVYAPHVAFLLLVFTCIVEALQRNDVRFHALSGFLFGLATALQPLLSAVFLPVIVVGWFMSRTNRTRIALLFLLFAAVGFATNLYIVLRAMAHPTINWDDPVTWSRFWNFLLARDFQVFFHSPTETQARVDFLRGEIWTLLPLPILAMGILGAVFAWKILRKREALLVFVGAVSTSSAWLLKDFHMNNPDSHAYILFSIAGFILLSAVFVQMSLEQIGALRHHAALRSVLTAILLAALLPIGKLSLSASRSSGGDGAFRVSRFMQSAPPAATLIVTSDHWLFPFWYHGISEGLRPDVRVIGTELWRAKWYRQQVETLWPLGPVSGGRYAELAGDSLGILSSSWAQKDLEPLWKYCRAAHRTGAFNIESSICAQIAMTASQNELKDRSAGAAIDALERYLGLRSTNLQCETLKSLDLPFPLLRDRDSTFLVQPTRPLEELALIYLQCERPDLAFSALSASPAQRSVDSSLLLAWLFLGKGDKANALEAFENARKLLASDDPLLEPINAFTKRNLNP